MTGKISRSRSGEMHLCGTGQPTEAEEHATVLAVLHRVESDRLTLSEACQVLEALGLVEMAREMQAARKGRAA